MRHFYIIYKLVQISLQTSMQYRINFLIESFFSFFWLIWHIAPLTLIYHTREEIGGWRYPQAMMVIAWFLILQAVLEGVISPNLMSLVEHIRKGTLDFILLKPIDAQMFVSVSRIVPAKTVDVIGGAIMVFWACHRLRISPSVPQILTSLFLLIVSMIILYSVWLLVVSTAFWLISVNNLSYLFMAIFDAGRWPITIFKGVIRFILTFIIPVGLMTSFPAMSLLGMLSTAAIFQAVSIALIFATLSRFVWQYALRHYTSASS